MTPKERFDLITRNLEEVIGEKELKDLLKKKKEPAVYWGTMPTGSPHISYYFPLLKVADFLKAGLNVKILIADLHAALAGVKWDVLDKRQKYYEELIPSMLKSIGVNTKKLEFVKGSKIQLNPRYSEDLLKMSMATSTRDTTRAASEVVKLDTNPKPGKQANKKRPLVLKEGSNIRDVAEHILKGYSKNVKETIISGPSSKFSNQRVGLNHKVKDLDVVEFHTR